MKLSPVTNYYIRKLLRQSSQQLAAQSSFYGAHPDSFIDLDAILKHLYSEAMVVSAVMQQLEALAQVHQELGIHGSSNLNYKNWLEQQIFQLLGVSYQ